MCGRGLSCHACATFKHTLPLARRANRSRASEGLEPQTLFLVHETKGKILRCAQDDNYGSGASVSAPGQDSRQPHYGLWHCLLLPSTRNCLCANDCVRFGAAALWSEVASTLPSMGRLAFKAASRLPHCIARRPIVRSRSAPSPARRLSRYRNSTAGTAQTVTADWCGLPGRSALNERVGDTRLRRVRATAIIERVEAGCRQRVSCKPEAWRSGVRLVT
jgi:hypothetical protein